MDRHSHYSTSSAPTWIFIGFVVIVVMAILLGADIKNSTWFNPDIAAAQAKQIEIDSAHQQATYALQERLATAQTEAEIQAIQREQKLLDAQYERQVRLLAQDVANRQRWTNVLINLVNFLGGGIGIAAIIGVLIITIARAVATLKTTPKDSPVAKPTNHLPAIKIIHPKQAHKPFDPLESPMQPAESLHELQDRRLAERLQELTHKKDSSVLAARMKAVLDPARMSKAEYHKRPLVN